MALGPRFFTTYFRVSTATAQIAIVPIVNHTCLENLSHNDNKNKHPVSGTFSGLHFVHIDLLQILVFKIFFFADSNQTTLLHNAHTVSNHFSPKDVVG
jgi:hypothetical protein